MAFDAKKAVIDKLTHLEDELKQVKSQRSGLLQHFESEISRLEAEIAGWQALIVEPTPVAKKTVSKK